VTELLRTLGLVSETLDEMAVNWALVGGLAVSAHVEPRFTRDIDIVIAVEDAEDAEMLVHEWTNRGFVLDQILDQQATGRLATVRTHSSGGSATGIVVDLLFASSGIEPEIAHQAQVLQLGKGVTAPVARPGHLFALKLLSVDADDRPQDLVDLKALAAAMDALERERAREAVELIEERGEHS